MSEHTPETVNEPAVDEERLLKLDSEVEKALGIFIQNKYGLDWKDKIIVYFPGDTPIGSFRVEIECDD